METKTKKTKEVVAESMEQFPLNKYVDEFGFLEFGFVFSLDYFLSRATEIVKDCGYYGYIVLSDKGNAYGLLIKDTGADDNDVYMKAHVYRWPQYGMIRGGVSFWPGTKNFAEQLKEAIAKVK